MQVKVDEGFCYVGSIIQIDPIEGADLIVSATVVCGKGGKWRGVIKKGSFRAGDLCVVFLPDAIVPNTPEFAFMEKYDFRVRMQRLRGAPSEVLIGKVPEDLVPALVKIGTDLTSTLGIMKFHKPVPAHLNGVMKSLFPNFIPKTDEPHYNREDSGADEIEGHDYYVALKYDGSSTTAYKLNGVFGVCSRNLELEYDPEIGYWKIADEYNLKEHLPEGIALQWETVGPGIQGNKLGFKNIQGIAFSGYKIREQCYMSYKELKELCAQLSFPMAITYLEDNKIPAGGFFELGQIKHNGVEAEGVVVRTKENVQVGKPISFKVINLNYET